MKADALPQTNACGLCLKKRATPRSSTIQVALLFRQADPNATWSDQQIKNVLLFIDDEQA
jgi:hypothetical protein